MKGKYFGLNNTNHTFLEYTLLLIYSKALFSFVTVAIKQFNLATLLGCTFFWGGGGVALRPNAGHGLLILDVFRSHTTTHHSR
jgi:hypothetical protein